MAIRDHWNRMLRKSFSSSSSSAGDRSSSPVPEDGTESLSKPTSRLAKTLTWRSSGARPKSPTAPTQKKKKKAAQSQFVHPSERELTEANLRHQELLSGFTMKFGRRRASAGGRTSFSGISPGNSRQASVDASYAPHHGAGHHSGFDERRISSLVNNIPQEDAESQQ